MTERIGLIGAGGHADEVESYTGGKALFRAVTESYLSSEAEVNVMRPPEDLINKPVHIAVGAPGLRKRLHDLWPGENYRSVIAAGSYIDKTSYIGEGSLVAPGVVITTRVKLGNYAIVNVASSIQHNSEIGDYATVSPGVRIGGDVTAGDGVFLGIGAIVKNGVTIAPGVVLGAGAVLLHDAEVENGVYVGVPARHIKTNEGWLHEI